MSGHVRLSGRVRGRHPGLIPAVRAMSGRVRACQGVSGRCQAMSGHVRVVSKQQERWQASRDAKGMNRDTLGESG
jgi:hypothetical protein